MAPNRNPGLRPFRETRHEVGVYQAEGVLVVDMELAALLAVAQVRGVRAAIEVLDAE